MDLPWPTPATQLTSPGEERQALSSLASQTCTKHGRPISAIERETVYASGRETEQEVRAMGGDAMSGKKFEEAILAIHETLNKAERQLSRLGENLAFLISPNGDLEIVRRDEDGEPVRPKIVIAELTGTDPMFWRPEHPRWMKGLEPRLDADPVVPKRIGRESCEKLREMGYLADYKTYPMEHAVCMEEIADVSGWFQDILVLNKGNS